MIGSAILANLLDPKLTIFFFAFLPQFVPTQSSDQLGTMLALSAVFMAMTFVVFAVYGVFAAGVRGNVIDRRRIIRRLRKTFAAAGSLARADRALGSGRSRAEARTTKKSSGLIQLPRRPTGPAIAPGFSKQLSALACSRLRIQLLVDNPRVVRYTHLRVWLKGPRAVVVSRMLL